MKVLIVIGRVVERPIEKRSDEDLESFAARIARVLVAHDEKACRCAQRGTLKYEDRESGFAVSVLHSELSPQILRALVHVSSPKRDVVGQSTAFVANSC